MPETFIKVVSMLCDQSTPKIKVAGVLSDGFPINVSVHQGSAISPLLFTANLDGVTKECRIGDPWELLYAVNLV